MNKEENFIQIPNPKNFNAMTSFQLTKVKRKLVYKMRERAFHMKSLITIIIITIPSILISRRFVVPFIITHKVKVQLNIKFDPKFLSGCHVSLSLILVLYHSSQHHLETISCLQFNITLHICRIRSISASTSYIQTFAILKT